MKKLKLFLLILLMFPIFIKADHSAPMVIEYDARVKSSEAEIIDLDDWFNGKSNVIKIPYGTTFKVVFEEYQGFPTSSSKEKAILAEIEYNEKSYYIKLSDIEPITNEINFDELEKCDHKFYVYKKGAFLYKGPSTIYGKLDGEVEVPAGQVLTCEYTDQSVDEDAEGWVYTTYNGTSGWLYVNQHCEGGYTECPSVVKYSQEQKEVTTIRKATIYVVENEKSKVIAKVPKGAKIQLIGYTTYVEYVRYNGKEGFVDSELLYEYGDGEDIVLEKDRGLYDVDDFYSGIIDVEYETALKNLAPLLTIPAGTKLSAKYVDTMYYTAYYVTYNGKTGVVTDYLDEFEDEENEETVEENEDISPEIVTGENEEVVVEAPLEVVEEKAASPASIKSRVKYYVIGAVGLALIAIILILLINRKNKKNKVEPVVENNVTEMPVENNAEATPENNIETPVENNAEVTPENNPVESEPPKQSDQE